MIIAIAGIKRSGSTLLYNAVRLTLEHAGMEPHIYGESNRPPYDEPAIIKIHRFRKDVAEQADHVFISNRGYTDVKDSLERFNGEEQRWERLVLFYKWLQRWSLYSTPEHYFEYKDLTEDIEGCVKRIASILRVYVVPENIVKELQQIEPPENGQDPKTLLFSNHITQG